MTVAVLVPVLRRPHRIAPFLESLERSTPEPHRTLFLCTPDDHAVIDAVKVCGGKTVLVPYLPGDYARKINTGYRATLEPLLFLAADDLAFHPYWLERAAEKMVDGIGVVGTNDRCSARVMRGEHSTHSLVSRAYADVFGTIDERGKILHEGYPHEFCDDELVQTAISRDAFAFANDSIVAHLHPMVGRAPMDALYAEQPQRMRQGRKVYQRRRRLWT